jgi:hypothetical protein
VNGACVWSNHSRYAASDAGELNGPSPVLLWRARILSELGAGGMNRLPADNHLFPFKQ